MEGWGTPPLTGCSCEDVPCRTTQIHLLLRKQETRPKNQPGNSEDWVWEENQNAAPCRKPLVYQQPQRVAPHLLKALPVPIRYNPQDLQLIEKTWNHSGNYKGSHTSRGDQHTYWYLQRLWQIEVDKDLLSQLSNCRNIVCFQISSKIGSW